MAVKHIIDDVMLEQNLSDIKQIIDTKVDNLYNKIMGITSEDSTTVDEAFDTLKEVANYIKTGDGSAGTELINKIATIEELLNNKVDSIQGKSLVDDSEITRLSKVDNYDDTEVRGLIAGKVNAETGKSLISNTEITRLSKVDNYDDTEVRGLIAGKGKVDFTSGDSTSATSYTSVGVLSSGSTLSSLFNSISKMFKNIRYLYSKVTTLDSDVDNINDELSNVFKKRDIPDNTNIDDLHDRNHIGSYWINCKSDSTITGTHPFTGSYYRLIVSFGIQIAISSTYMYARIMYDGSWTTWIKCAKNSDLSAKLDASGYTDTPSRVLIINSAGKIVGSSRISTAILNYLENVTGDIQDQLDAKAKSSGYTESMVLISNSNGKISTSSKISTTELGYLDGLKTNIQTHIDNSLKDTSFVNKTFNKSVTVNASSAKELTFDVSYSGYTPLAVSSFNSGKTTIYVPTAAVDATDSSAVLTLVNTTTSSITVTAQITILYVKNM